MYKESDSLEHFIRDALRYKSKCKIRLDQNQITIFRQYWPVIEEAKEKMRMYLGVLQRVCRVVLERRKQLLEMDRKVEFLSMVTAYVHEQEFVKAYLQLINDYSRRTWIALC